MLLGHFGQAPDLSFTWTVSLDKGTSIANQVSLTWMIFLVGMKVFTLTKP